MPNYSNTVVTDMIIYTDDSSHNTPAYVYTKQYDVRSRYIHVTLMSATGKISVEGTSRLNVLKPNGEAMYVVGTTQSDGTVLFALPSALLTDVGNASCDIRVYDATYGDQVVLTSSTFYIIIDKALYDEEAIDAQQIPAPPLADGTYVLKAIISNGTIVYSWVPQYGNDVFCLYTPPSS